MYPNDLIKGTIPVIILKLLADNNKMYGYQISKKVLELTQNKIQLREGSLYPALHKLSEKNLVEIETVNIGRRVRRYYTLTDKGISHMQERIAETRDFIKTIDKILS
jgi:DNA-binding PadR family transcriptional regulator